MKLYSSTTSPFGRMVVVSAKELDIINQIEIINNALLSNPTDYYNKVSPVGKIPVLLDGERKIIETNLIIDYLQIKADKSSLIPTGSKRVEMLQLVALTNNALEAGILFFYETLRDKNQQSEEYKLKLKNRVVRIFSYLSTSADIYDSFGEDNNYAKISLVSVFGFFNFRLLDHGFTKTQKTLQALADKYENQYSSFDNTKPYFAS